MEREPFRARPPWYGPHLQTMRNPLSRAPHLSTGEGRRVSVPLGDGDVVQLRLDAPARPDDRRPRVVLVHGLGGCETSAYMLHASRFFTDRGAHVYRASLRGAGPSQATCRDWSHAGRFEDLDAVIAGLDAGPAGLVVIGFSLGGCVLLNHLAHGRVDSRLIAAASVSAPLDLTGAADVLHAPRNRLYHDYLLRALKRDYLNPHARLTAAERARIATACTLYEVDDRFTAPRHGFGRAERYYRFASPLGHLGAIERPTLLAHACDDPFVPVAPYAVAEGRAIEVAVADGGGHLGFHERSGPWHLLRIERFLAAVTRSRSTGVLSDAGASCS